MAPDAKELLAACHGSYVIGTTKDQLGSFAYNSLHRAIPLVLLFLCYYLYGELIIQQA